MTSGLVGLLAAAIRPWAAAAAFAAPALGVGTDRLAADTIPPTAGGVAAAEAQQPVTFDAARFDSVTAAGLRVLLDSASQQGLPTAPLINRALEGAARRVPGGRILQVVHAHAVALAQAQAALGPGTPAMELDAGATALRAGVDVRDLSAVRATRGAGTAVVPIVVLTDLVQRGIPARSARDAVTQLARQPGSDDALRALQVTVAKNAVRGPGMAVDALGRYLKGTASGGVASPAPATTDRKPVRPPSL